MTTETNHRTNIFFQSTPCLSAHVLELKNDPVAYINELQFLCRSGTFAVISSAVRARILAALHISSKHRALEALLEHCEATDICKALVLLDRPRTARQLRQKIQRIEERHPVVVSHAASAGQQDLESRKKKQKKKRKVDEYSCKRKTIETELQEADHNDEGCAAAHADSGVQELIQSASVSGALAQKVRRWAKTSLPSDFLEFVMLTLPSGPWQTLADLVHFSPGDFCVPYFLHDVHKDRSKDEEIDNSQVPESSFVTRMRELVKNSDSEDANQKFFTVAEEFPQTFLAYSFIRTQPALMSRPEIVEQFAALAPLDTVIWYFEEFHLASRKCEDIVHERLQGSSEDLLQRSGTKSKATYGKLVERILTFRRMGLKFADDIVPIAEARLRELKSFWKKGVDAKVAVFGDASYSMQCAIEAATIFASMVSLCFDGELSFFQSELVRSPHERPGNVRETLEVCDRIRANNCTSNAAALWPYFEQKKIRDLFVMVTDEWENTSRHGHMFAGLFAKYKREVNPKAKLVIVCVGKGNKEFRQSLDNHDIEYKVVYIDESRPDLAKFDALLGQLALVSSRCVASRRITGEVKGDDAGADADEFVLV